MGVEFNQKVGTNPCVCPSERIYYMSYPESSEVSAGQPTAVDHYNNLRKDAVYLGKDPDNAVSLGSLLYNFESRLKLELLDTDRLRVPVTTNEPVCLVIDGYMCRNASNTDLASGDRPSGAAADYYVFAVRSSGFSTFTLEVNTSSTESSGKRRIGGFYWNGSAIVESTIYTEFSALIEDLISFVTPHICNGRLTLTTGTPINPSDVSGASTLYFTSYAGNRISLYHPSLGWRVHELTEVSISLAGLTASKPHDVFVYDNAGTLTLEMVEWSNLTARATSLTKQDGVLVKSGDASHRYLGTVFINSSGGQTDDALRKRFVWNYYNRRPWSDYDKDETDSWTLTAGAGLVATNGGAECWKFEFVIGVDEDPIIADALLGTTYRSAHAIAIDGIALDRSKSSLAYTMVGNTNPDGTTACHFSTFPGVGYHYLQHISGSSAVVNTTAYGDNGALFGSDNHAIQSGMRVQGYR